MLNIAIIEDNAPLRESLVDILSAEGHHVSAFDSAESLQTNSSIATLDIVLLDLNLPGEDGVTLARRLRASKPGIGIIMLTARVAPEDRRTGYDSGADIYLTKPSSSAELTSSIWALSRRLDILYTGGQPLSLNMKSLRLSGSGGDVKLSASEAALLERFVHAPDNRLETADIMRLHSQDENISKATIGVKIVRLRKKLLMAGAVGQPINVIRNWGYQLSTDIVLT
jgi:DNA-binding response OmpR family regulator